MPSFSEIDNQSGGGAVHRLVGLSVRSVGRSCRFCWFSRSDRFGRYIRHSVRRSFGRSDRPSILWAVWQTACPNKPTRLTTLTRQDRLDQPDRTNRSIERSTDWWTDPTDRQSGRAFDGPPTLPSINYLTADGIAGLGRYAACMSPGNCHDICWTRCIRIWL